MTAVLRLIACDVDGTLLTSNDQLTDATLAAWNRLIDVGIEVVLATSRGPSGLTPVISRLPVRPDWWITLQGALAGSTSSSEASLVDERLLGATTSDVIGRALEAGASVAIYQYDRMLTPQLDLRVHREAEITGEAPIELDSIATLGPVHKILCMGDDDEEGRRLMAQLRDDVAATTRGLNATLSKRHYLEITSVRADKGRALKKLCHRLKIPIEQVAAIGDGDNDFSMLEIAGRGVAMGGSSSSLRAIADFVTASSDGDGVARAVDWLLQCRGEQHDR